MKKFNIPIFVFSLALPLVMGMISAALSSGQMAAYGLMEKPPLSPPSWVFPLAWTILYLLMGLASYYIFVSDHGRGRTLAMLLYFLQLAMNFFWSLIFFRWGMLRFAFVWLVVLLLLVYLCAYAFHYIYRPSGLLLGPYLLWLVFAAYLNLGVCLLNLE